MEQRDHTNARQRSVDNLQRLYTVIIALALTKAVELLVVKATLNSVAQSTIGFLGSIVSSNTFPMFAALAFTVTPFYHGANRFLDDTYVFNPNPPKPHLNMFDYAVFFGEALLFLLMALTLDNGSVFFGFYLCLLLVDFIWAFLIVAPSDRDGTGCAKKWGWLNLGCLVLVMVLLSLQFQSEARRFQILSAIAVLRTILDYKLCWKMYWVPSDSRPAAASLTAAPPA